MLGLTSDLSLSQLTKSNISLTPLTQSNMSLNPLTQSNMSLNQSHPQNSQDAPFSQQFNYHLQDLAIVRRAQPLKPDGKVRVHLPNITSIEIEFNLRESIESFRERLQEHLKDKINVSQYYIVSRHGTIEDGMSLDECFVTPDSNLLLIRKGIKDRQQLANRRFWIKSREMKNRGEPRPLSQTSTLPKLRKHRVTPYIATEMEEQEIKNKKKLYPAIFKKKKFTPNQ